MENVQSYIKKKQQFVTAGSQARLPKTVGLWMGLIFSAQTNTHLLRTVFSTDDKVETFPVLEIKRSEIVDTTGAGDAFVGGTCKAFLCSLVEKSEKEVYWLPY